MTSWLGFLRKSAPWYWWLLAGAGMPLWIPRIRKVWKFAGGWTQRYGRRSAVGIKPPRLIEESDRTIGRLIFVHEEDLRVKLQHITCHELVHACTGHLTLPTWLNEGLAMLGVDEYLEKPTVRPETIEFLRDGRRCRGTRRKRYLPLGDRDALVYHYVSGYWLTRYLHETRPDLLRRLLAQRRSRKVLESDLAAAFGKSRKRFWREIDGMVAAHFG
jgi:hypothetical protein